MFGRVQQLDSDQWQLRFTRTLRHPQTKVWRAITEPAHLAAWFPSTIEGERKAGAPLRFVFPDNIAEPIDGEMLAFEPESLMELRWGTDIIRIELRPVAEGTELTLLDTLDERGKAARDAAGWHTCLDALEAHLSGEPGARDQMSKWSEVHPQYVESFGPAGATIGPPASVDAERA